MCSMLVDEGATAAGRNPDNIRKICNVSGTITTGNFEPAPTRGATPVAGPPTFWVEVLAGWAETLGFDTFILWPETPTAEQIRRFAMEIAPALRSGLTSNGPRCEEAGGSTRSADD
jgi:hypothetical protein